MNSNRSNIVLRKIQKIVAEHDSFGTKRRLFDQHAKIVRWTIKTKVNLALAANLDEVQAGELVMTALNTIPFETISKFELDMIGKIVYAYPSYLQYLKGDLSTYLQKYFLTSFQKHERLTIEDHIIIDTLHDAQINQFIHKTYKNFIIPIEQRTEVNSSYKYKKSYSNILIKYNHYLNDNEFANLVETLCFLLDKNVKQVRRSNLSVALSIHYIIDDLINLMPRLTALQLCRFYEVFPKSLSLANNQAQVVIPLFRFFQHLKNLPAAKDITFNAGNELIHNYLRYYNNTKINHDYIDIIREYHHGASLETMILLVEVMLDNLEYNVSKRFYTLNSVIEPPELYRGEFNGRVNEDLMVKGYIVLAKLFDLLPQLATSAIGRKFLTFYPSDWDWILVHFTPLKLSLDVFAPVIPYDVITAKFETDLANYQQGLAGARENIPNNLELLSHYLELLKPEKCLKLVNFLLAQTNNDDPEFRDEAFDSLLEKFDYFKAVTSPAIIQDFFDMLHLDPFKRAQQIIVFEPAAVGTERQRDELIDSLTSIERRDKFMSSLEKADYSIIATTKKFPTILAILCQHILNICENPNAELNDGLLPILKNILSLLFFANGKKSDWELDNSSRLLLTRFVSINRLSNPHSFKNIELYLTFTTGMLRICHRIGEGELMLKCINSYLTSWNDLPLRRTFPKLLIDKLKSAAQLIVEDPLSLLKNDSSHELRTNFMIFFLSCIGDDLQNDPVFNLADIIIDSSKKESELVDACKAVISAMNDDVGNFTITQGKINLLEILIIFFPLIKTEECLKLCALFMHNDPRQKALFAIAIKSQERQRKITDVIGIPDGCAQIIIAYEKYVGPGLRLRCR